MRTIGFRSNVLFALAAACGLVAALGRPWYGPAVPTDEGRLEGLGAAIGRALSDPDGTDGWTAFATVDTLLAGLAGASALLVLLALVPALQREAGALARWCALAAVGVVVVKLVDGPDGAAMAEPRNGSLLALAAALVLLASASTVAAAPARARRPNAPFGRA
jgi:hypothetical protein